MLSRALKSLKTGRMEAESEKNQSVKRKSNLKDGNLAKVSKTAMIDLFYDKVANDEDVDENYEKNVPICEETNIQKTGEQRQCLQLHNPTLLETIEMAEYERANDAFRTKTESRKQSQEKLKCRFVSPDYGRRIFEACISERYYSAFKRAVKNVPRLPRIPEGNNNSHPVYNTVVKLLLDECLYERYLTNQLLPSIFKYTDELYKYPRGIIWSYVLVTILREFNRDAILLVNGKRTTFKAEVLKYVTAKFVDGVNFLSDIPSNPVVEGPAREANFLKKFIKLAVNSIWLCAINFVIGTAVTVKRFDSAHTSVYVNEDSLRKRVKIVNSTLFYDNRSGYWLYKTPKGGAYFDQIESILANVTIQ